MHQSIAHLCILSVALFFWVAIVLGQSSIVNAKFNLIAGDELKRLITSSSNHALIVTETVTAGSDTAINISMITVTVTTIETTIIESVTASLDELNSSSAITVSSRRSADDQISAKSIKINYDPDAGTDTRTSNVDPVGTSSTAKATLLVHTKGPVRYPSSVFSSLRGTHGNSSATTFATITSVTSSSLSTSTFNEAICDDIFCNTEGNRVCIYWAGVTSWDVSRGPMPGERPTVLGPC
ncbi:hypothetical protein F5Y12DRAFT_794933 [Xylaria sp. FL1777]|nr:hypothetical protein F5Y12DRAFT_794933 [Xylaria sp. FL1777]